MSLIIQTDCSVKTGTLNLDAFEAPIPVIIWEKSGICSFNFLLEISYDGILRNQICWAIWCPVKYEDSPDLLDTKLFLFPPFL